MAYHLHYPGLHKACIDSASQLLIWPIECITPAFDENTPNTFSSFEIEVKRSYLMYFTSTFRIDTTLSTLPYTPICIYIYIYFFYLFFSSALSILTSRITFIEFFIIP